MAENENSDIIEEEPDEQVEGEEGSEETKKRFALSKPLMIKIGIGFVVLLLVSGAAYYFLMPEETPPEVTENMEEATAESDVITSDEDAIEVDIEGSETATMDTDSMIDLPVEEEATKTAEDVTKPDVSDATDDAINNEDDVAKIRAELSALKAENMLLKQKAIESDTQPSADNPLSTEPKPNSIELDNNQYIDSYQSDRDNYPSRRLPQKEAIPDPKWGD